MWVYRIFYQIKQNRYMNKSSTIYFRVTTVLNCFGDDHCPGLNFVSNEVETAVLNLVVAACYHCIQQQFLLYLGALLCIAKQFRTDHEALHRCRSELLIVLELV